MVSPHRNLQLKVPFVDGDSLLIGYVDRLREYSIDLRKRDVSLTVLQVNYRMRATLGDGRQLVGQMLAFDKVRST